MQCNILKRRAVWCIFLAMMLLFGAAEALAAGQSSAEPARNSDAASDADTASDPTPDVAAAAGAGAAAIAGAAGGSGAGKRFTRAVKDTAKKIFGSRCVFCGRETTDKPGPSKLEIDHAVPKSRGGNNTLDNAQTTCRSCNRKKGASTTSEFLDRLRRGTI